MIGGLSESRGMSFRSDLPSAPRPSWFGLEHWSGSGAAVMGAPTSIGCGNATERCSWGAGEFRDRLAAVAAEHAADPLVGKIIDFLRGGPDRVRP